MAEEDKVRANRLRRAAARQGLQLNKSRRRDPRALDYDGWMITELSTNTVVAGATPHKFSMTLDEVEKYLTRD
jgi:hypothetical protein